MAQMKYFYELTVSGSPHAHAKTNTQTIMRDVLIALLPALAGSVYFFGLRALMVTAISAASAVFFEWAYRKLMKLDSTAYDLSAVVTGVLLAFVCPPTIPYWCVVLGGSLRHHRGEAALRGHRSELYEPRPCGQSLPVQLAGGHEHMGQGGLGECPRGVFHRRCGDGCHTAGCHAPRADAGGTHPRPVLGQCGGLHGETSALLLLVGFAYLLIRRIISPRIPLAYIGTVAVIALVFPQGNDRLMWTAAQLFSGGLFLGAIFMATDYVTSPVTKLGQIIFGIGCGVLTMLIRYFGGYNEGVSYAILVMNACVVLLDKIGRPKKFGAPKKEVAGK